MQGEEESLLKAHNEEEKEKREYEKEDVEKEKIKEDKEAKPSEEKTNSSPQSTNKPPSYARPPPSETRTHAPHHEKKSAKVGGFFDFLTKVANDVGREIEVGFEKLGESIDKEVHNRNTEGERHFQEQFQLPSNERLLGAYGCKVLNGDSGVAGTAYISASFFCFHGGSLKILVPLQSIVKLQKALRIRDYQQPPASSGEGRRVHTFQPVPSTARGDCIQLYTNDHMIHHFFSDTFTFGPLHNMVLTFESFYKMVEETWRYAAVPHRPTEDEGPPVYTPQRDPAFEGEQPQQQAQQGQQEAPQQPPPQWQPFPQQQVPPAGWQVPSPVFSFPQQPSMPPPDNNNNPQQPSAEDLSSRLAQLGPTPQEQPKNSM